MDVVECRVKMSFVPYSCIGKLIPNTAFSRQVIFDIPLAGCRSMQVFERGGHVTQRLNSRQNMIVIWQNHPGDDIIHNFPE